MKTIHVQYFATLREQRGVSNESVRTTAATPRELYEEISIQHRFSLGPDRLRVVLNESFVAWDAELQEGDTLVFIPPVAGG